MSPVLEQHSRNRSTTSVAGRLPDFVIIGAMKSGTTTLCEYLCRHPQIFLSEPKEPGFFSHDERYARGENWYRSHFQGAGLTQLCGEASTCYSRHTEYPHTAIRLAKCAPQAKLIYILRHPVERAYSAYGHVVERIKAGALRTQGITPPHSFEEARTRFSSHIIDPGLYIRELERYSTYFARDQILCLIFEDFIRTPERTVAEVLQFVGVKYIDLVASNPILSNQSGAVAQHDYVRKMVNSYRQLPGLGLMTRLLPPFCRPIVRNMLVQGAVRLGIGVHVARRHRSFLTPLTPELRAELLKAYRPTMAELEDFLGRRLPDWNV